MRNAVLLLCSVLIVGASAVAQTAPAAAPAGVSQAAPVKAQKIVPAPPPALSDAADGSQTTTVAIPAHNPPASRASKVIVINLAPPPLHPLTDVQAMEMLKLTHADRLRKQVITMMLANINRSFPPYTPADVIDDLKTSLENVDLDPAIVKIYQEHISEKDAAAIITFYKSPAGQHMVSVTPIMMHEVAQAGAVAGRSAVLEVLERHKAEIQAAAQKYKDLHWIPPAQPQP